MMPHASGRFRGKEVATRRLEELQNRLVLERRRIRHVDDNLSARKRFSQSLARDGVDAGGGRCRHDLMAKLAQPVDEFRSDEPAATDDYDLHVRHTLRHGASIRCRPQSAVDVRAECLQAGPKTLQRPSIAIGFILIICPRGG